MRNFALLLIIGLLLAVGCTTTPREDRPKVLCPACGSELDAVIHKHF
jgi:prepilin signal peptidase PulO-like enzyme (type II secretory pathway)